MADAADEDQDLAEPEPAVDERRRAGRFWAGLLGAFSLVGGLTWMLLNLHGPQPVVDLGVGIVLAAGGLILLMPHRIALPAKLTWLTALVAGVAGSAAGVLSGTSELCCMYASVEQRGFPFQWLSRGAVADDPDTARRLADAAAWHWDVSTLLVDVLVWAYAGIVVVALITGLRRRR